VPDPTIKEAWLTFVVIGGGPTGVELAGAIAEVARHTMARDLRSIDPTRARILLLEGGSRVLSTFAANQSADAERSLRDLGVEVRTGARVTHVSADAVSVGAELIPTRTALWAPGVETSPLGKALGVPTDRAGHVAVKQDLTLPGHPEIYVVGDLALFTHSTGSPLPGVAPVTIQQSRAAAENIGVPSEASGGCPSATSTVAALRRLGERLAWRRSGRSTCRVWRGGRADCSSTRIS
jgi:NADH dehydrogenase